MYRIELCDWFRRTVDVKSLDIFDLGEIETTRRWLTADSAAFTRESAEAVVYAEQMALPDRDGGRLHWMYSFERLSLNPSPEAIELLRRHPERINWTLLVQNPHPEAIAWVRAAPEKAGWDWAGLNPNPEMVPMMLARVEELVRDNTMRDFGYGYMVQGLSLCQSAEAVAFLERHPEHICWDALAGNPHPAAVELLFRSRTESEIVAWSERFGLSMNTHPRALALLAANPGAINWSRLSANPAPEELAILAANVRCIEWRLLCRNPNPAAMRLVLANLDGLKNHYYPPWSELAKNACCFERVCDYPAMRARMDLLREDLSKAAFHPRRVARFLDMGGDIDDL